MEEVIRYYSQDLSGMKRIFPPRAYQTDANTTNLSHFHSLTPIGRVSESISDPSFDIPSRITVQTGVLYCHYLLQTISLPQGGFFAERTMKTSHIIHVQSKERIMKLNIHPVGNPPGAMTAIPRYIIRLFALILLIQGVHAGFISGDFSGEALLFTSPESMSDTTGNESLNETVTAQMAGLPLSFIPNEGQNNDPGVRFMVKGSGTSFSFTHTSMLFSIQRSQNETPLTITQKFIGANESVRLSGEDILPGTANYFIGDDPYNWRSNISTYGVVRYHDLYPGIDLLYKGNGSVLKREFLVSPGSAPSLIRMEYEGADSLSIDESGSLKITAGAGTMIESRPVCFQEIDGTRVDVGARYILTDRDGMTIAVDAYDPAYELVIDPNLVYSTGDLGGWVGDTSYGIAVDASGNAYVTGYTSCDDFPTTAGAYQTSYGGDYDAFVTKLNAAGTALVYSTYLRGSGDDRGYGIKVDASGNAYVTGYTESTNFPTTAGAYKRTKAGGQDAFVTKLNAAGTALVYSTYLGGSDLDGSNEIVVDASGNAYVTGSTKSTNFPTTTGAYQTAYGGGDYDAFVTKLNSAGTALVYSTYLGSSGLDYGEGIAMDRSGNAYVTGSTDGSFLPTTAGANLTASAGSIYDDVFVAKLNSAGTALVYFTYWGGSSGDGGSGIAVDASGNAYVTGSTYSTDFPTTAGAYQKTFAGYYNVAFISKLNAAGTALVYSTYLGYSGSNGGSGIAVDASGNAYVTGSTDSDYFPTTAGAYQTSHAGENIFNDDAFVTKLNSAGTALVYSTFLGGSSHDQGYGIVVDASRNAYVTGSTWSTDFPTTAGAYQRTTPYDDAFVTKFSLTVIQPMNNIGVFRNSKWYLDYNGNGAWNGPSTDRQYTFGQSGDKPVTGDWNKDGKTKIGVFRGKTWYLDYNGNGAWNGPSTDRQYIFGLSSDIPVTGDWNGDGKTEIGVFRGKTWYLDYNGNGVWNGPSTDRQYTFGLEGYKPVTGDWNKDGKTDISVFYGNTWYLDYNGNGAWNGPSTDRQYTFGVSGDIPVTGKWSGVSGTSSIQSVELNPVTKPDSVFKVPDVKRPVAAVPKVEMPVKSNSVINAITPGVVPSQSNPLVSGRKKISGNPLS